MNISYTEDIWSISELKKDTKKVLDHAQQTGRPVIVTVNGKAESVILDVHVFERYIKLNNLTQLLAPAEEDINKGRVKSARSFLKEFKNGKKI